MKLIYAAEGAALNSVTATTIRFAIMAVMAQLVLSDGGQADPSSDDDAEEAVPPTGAFWLNAAELGAWGCAGTQLTSLSLQELPAVRARR